jgi:hypothetical protein
VLVAVKLIAPVSVALDFPVSSVRSLKLSVMVDCVPASRSMMGFRLSVKVWRALARLSAAFCVSSGSLFAASWALLVKFSIKKVSTLLVYAVVFIFAVAGLGRFKNLPICMQILSQKSLE